MVPTVKNLPSHLSMSTFAADRLPQQPELSGKYSVVSSSVKNNY